MSTSRPLLLGLDRMPRQRRHPVVLAVNIVLFTIALFTLWGPRSLEWTSTTPNVVLNSTVAPAPKGDLTASWGVLDCLQTRQSNVPLNRADSAFQTLGGMWAVDDEALKLTLALSFAAAALAWYFHRWVMRLPGPKGFCAECGYDLRGSESGRCPECGERIAGAP